MEYEEWMKKAEEDLNTAIFNLEGNKIDAGLFYLQQSAEKALKAVYIKAKKELIKTHDLVSLSRSLSAPENIIKFCTLLTPLYQQTRYPDALPQDIGDSIKELTSAAKEVLAWTKKQL